MGGTRISKRGLWNVAGISLLFLAYYSTARLGLWLDAVSGFATLVWAPSGISLAALLVFGYRCWPGIALGALAVNLSVGAPLAVAGGIAIGNTLEAVMGTFLLQRVAHFENRLERLRDVFSFTVLAATLSTLVSATLGAGSLWAGKVVSSSSFFQTWVAWWVGDALGDLIVGSLLLMLLRPPRFQWTRISRIELTAIAVLLIASTLVVFTGVAPVGVHAPIRQAYMVFPALIWAAVRFGPRGATIGTFLVSMMAIVGTVMGMGPFVASKLSESLLLLQLFMAVAAVTLLILSAAVSERNRAIEARDQFLSVASHELRTPLSTLSLHLQTLLYDAKRPQGFTPERAVAKLEKTEQQVFRLTHLIDEVLDISRVGAGKMQLDLSEFDLSAMVREVAVRFKDQLGTASTAVSMRTDQVIVGQWDRPRLEQVLTNLLTNAVKYGEGKPIKVVTDADDGQARISVTDLGAGIAPADQHRIFERFERAVPSGHVSGFGLGLWIAREIVTAHGGAIQVISKPGQGSTFTVELPTRL